jgi:hypothetical protein
VSAGAALAELALLWELATAIGLFCRVEGAACVLRTTPFATPFAKHDDKGAGSDEALVRELASCYNDGGAGGGGSGAGTSKRRKGKGKKRSFLKAVSEEVASISLDLARFKKEAREKGLPVYEGAAYLPGDNGRPPQSSAMRGERGVDNRPAWMTLRMQHQRTPLPPSAPACPLGAGNKGFDMLLKLGWAVDSGLGKGRSGIVEPIALQSQTPWTKKGLGFA